MTDIPGPDHRADVPEAEKAAVVQVGAPAISIKARQIIYITCLAVNALTILVGGVGIIFGLLNAEQAMAAGGLVIGVLGFVASGLGVAYKPKTLADMTAK